MHSEANRPKTKLKFEIRLYVVVLTDFFYAINFIFSL
jgi:hypothetical protein